MTSRGMRARAAIGDNFAVAVGLCLVLVLAGGWLTYGAHVDPGTEVERQTVEEWRSSADFDHAATVTRSNPVFERGATLENRSVYFSRVSPVLDGEFRYAVDSRNPTELSTVVDLTLVVRGVESDGESTTELWRVEEPLDETERTLGAGEGATVPFSVNVSRVAARGENVSDALGGAGSVETTVVATVTADGTVGDRDVSETTTYRLGVDPTGDTYRISRPETTDHDYTRTRRSVVPADPGALSSVGGPLALVFGLVGVAALAAGRRSGRLDVADWERERLPFERARAEFDEWVTAGAVPDEALDVPVVAVDSLEGLVDVAIDANGRAVEDEERGAFYVLTTDLAYRYDPPKSNAGGTDATGRTDTMDGEDATNGEDATDEPTAAADPTDGADSVSSSANSN